MSQRLIFLTIAFMVALTAFSEKGVITKEATMMCDSDERVLQGLCYFHAGEQGTGVLWDFSGLQGLCAGFDRSVNVSDINISVVYNQGADGLCNTGYALSQDLGLKDARLEKAYYYDSYDFLSGGMKAAFREASPPRELSPSDIDKIWNNAYEK